MVVAAKQSLESRRFSLIDYSQKKVLMLFVCFGFDRSLRLIENFLGSLLSKFSFDQTDLIDIDRELITGCLFLFLPSMKTDLIKQSILSYIDIANEWHEEGEGSLDEGVGNTMISLEQKILTFFGLPYMAQQYSDILQAEGFSRNDMEQRANELIKVLQHEAEKFLLAPIKKDSAILANARVRFTDALKILPIIDIVPTPYNCFLYYDVFLRGLCDEEGILLLFSKGESVQEFLEPTLSDTSEEIKDNKANLVKKDKDSLPFFTEYTEFLKYMDTVSKWDVHKSNFDLGDYFGLPDIFDLEHFVIKGISSVDNIFCCLSVLIAFGRRTIVELTLKCKLTMLQKIFLHAKYYTLALPPLNVVRLQALTGGAINITLKESVGKNVEVENLKMQIEKINTPNNKMEVFEYYISELLPKHKPDDLPF